jgi:hypothetical protein
MVFGNLPAQELALPTNYENGSNLNVIYRHDVSAQMYLTGRGLGFTFHQGRHLTSTSRSYYEVDIKGLHHPKQVKLTGEAPTRNRFVYGKLNSVMVIGGCLGMQKVLHAKADNKAIEVRFAYSLGPEVAIAKPYYIQVEKKVDPIKFDNESFTPSVDRVLGRGPFNKGMTELKYYPGINGKFNISFEYAPYTNLIRALETGISIDLFPKALPIMARNPAENVIITLRIGFVFGTKWY